MNKKIISFLTAFVFGLSFVVSCSKKEVLNGQIQESKKEEKKDTKQEVHYYHHYPELEEQLKKQSDIRDLPYIGNTLYKWGFREIKDINPYIAPVLIPVVTLAVTGAYYGVPAAARGVYRGGRWGLERIGAVNPIPVPAPEAPAVDNMPLLVQALNNINTGLGDLIARFPALEVQPVENNVPLVPTQD